MAKTKSQSKKNKLSLFETNMILSIGNKIIKELEKKHPDIELGKRYNGLLKPYLNEYIKEFIKEDYDFYAETDDLDENIEEALALEILHIECFCRWLDKEKGIKLK